LCIAFFVLITTCTCYCHPIPSRTFCTGSTKYFKSIFISYTRLTVAVKHNFCQYVIQETQLSFTNRETVQACITVIRHGLVSARRPSATTLYHRQERDLATEPSLWPAQLYGTVYQQQFVKLTTCIRLGSSSKHICLLHVLMTD